jgi:uncharacterized protein YbdZ (MbtH family)
MKKYILIALLLVFAVMNAHAEDVTIDGDGNLTTGSSNTNANLEVTGSSGEDGIIGSASGTGAAGVYGEHTTGGTVDSYGILGDDQYGVYGSSSGQAGHFEGDAEVTGNLIVGGSLIGPAIGDVTGVTAGTGLSGGGTSGNLTLNVNTTAIQQRVTGTCAVGSSIKTINSDGTVTCAIHNDSGGDITAVTAGTGLTGGSAAGDAALSVDTGYVQLRVSGSCQPGSSITGINADGTAVCSQMFYTQAQVDTLLALYEDRIEQLETLFPREWKTPVAISSAEGDASDPQMAIYNNGNAIAVWSQWDGTRQNISASLYTPESGWGTAELIETNDAEGSAYHPQVAIDRSGNAIAVWSQTFGAGSIWANRYTAGSGWGTPQLIEMNIGNARFPQIVIDRSGNAIVVWYERDGTQYSIWANSYTAGSSWGTAELIETYDAGSAYSPKLVVNESGNAIAVWSQSGGLWSNRYTAGSGWGTAEFIGTEDPKQADMQQIAINGSGNAIVVWRHFDGTMFSIWANTYTVGSGWGIAELIATDDTEDAHYPHIAIDGSGNAIAVWHQKKYGAGISIWANRYTVGSGWGTAELIETATGNAHSPRIAIDGSGNAIAVWNQDDGTQYSIWANRYTAENGWSTAELIETDSAGGVDSVRLAIHGGGNAMAVWSQSDGTSNSIWINRYDKK